MKFLKWIWKYFRREPTPEEVEDVLKERLNFELRMAAAHTSEEACREHRRCYEEYIRLSDQYLDQWGHLLEDSDGER